MKQCLVLSLLCMVGGSALAMDEAALTQTLKNAEAAALQLRQQDLELEKLKKQKEQYTRLKAARRATQNEENRALDALREAHGSLRTECHQLKGVCLQLRRENAEMQEAIDDLKQRQTECSSLFANMTEQTSAIDAAFDIIFSEFSSRLDWKGYDAFLRNFDFDSKDSGSQFFSAADLLIGNFEELLEARILSYRCSPDQDDYSLVREVVDLCSAKVRDLKALDKDSPEEEEYEYEM